MHKIILLWLLVLSSLAAHAQEAASSADAVLKQRVMALSAELRCLVCQNQSLADSHAELALDLKKQVREKLAAGMSEREVADFMVQRYGDFVLYRPPVKAATWLLWFGPFLLLAAGIGALGWKVRGSRRATPPAQQGDLHRAAALLDGKPMTGEGA